MSQRNINWLFLYVILGGFTIWGYHSWARSERSQIALEQPDEYQELLKTVDPERAAELIRRPRRLSNLGSGQFGRSYDAILNEKKDDLSTKDTLTAEPMPATPCATVAPVPPDSKEKNGPHRLHDLTHGHFVNESGFGLIRMFVYQNSRGKTVASTAIDRVELVSLLTEKEVSVYVLDGMASPYLARQAKRRPLDQFEQLALEAIRNGEELIGTPEAPKRMFGAIRADEDCLQCHAKAKEGELLGAFTYYLNVPVNQVEAWKRKKAEEK